MAAWLLLLLTGLAPELAHEHYQRHRPPTAAALMPRWYERHLTAAAGASSISALICANLVGFGHGAEGVWAMFSTLASLAGLRAAMVAWTFLFICVHIMLDLERWRSGSRGGALQSARASEATRAVARAY